MMETLKPMKMTETLKLMKMMETLKPMKMTETLKLMKMMETLKPMKMTETLKPDYVLLKVARLRVQCETGLKQKDTNSQCEEISGDSCLTTVSIGFNRLHSNLISITYDKITFQHVFTYARMADVDLMPE
ncbi:hypothetical protein M8J77_024637 [Diaphorina citri]|nr:hypothetical protein M8J77_024637 [Diaphorina citri]